MIALDFDLTSLMRKLLRRCARAYGQVDGWLYSERDRWALWIPVALGIGIASYFSLGKEPSLSSALWSGGLAISALLICFFVRLPRLAHTIIAFICVVIVGFSAVKIRTENVRAPVIERELKFVTITGYLLEAKSGADGKARLIIAPTSVGDLPDHATPKRIRVSYRGDVSGLLPGQLIRVRGSLMPPPVPVAPHGFDFARPAWFQGLGGLGFSFGRIDIIDDTPAGGLSMRAAIEIATFRKRISEHIRSKLEGDTGALAAALITGDRSGVPPGHTDALRDASLAHILAISGLHMGIAGWVLYGLVRFLLSLWPPIALHYPIKKIAAAAGLAGAAFYLILSGASISSQRAFIMIALMLTAIMVDRPAFTLRNVALAATLILIFQPESLMEAGFQMSFAACTALVATYEAKRHWQAQRFAQGKVVRNFDPNFFRFGWRNMSRRGSRYVGGLSLTSVIAGLSTAPFAAYHFNQFANYGLIANLLAVPVMGFIIMPMGIMALITMPFGLEGPFLKLMGFGIDYVMSVAFEISSWPQSVNHVSSWPPMALALIVLGSLWLCLWKTRWRLVGFAPACVGIVLAMMARPPDLVIDRDAGNIAVLASDGDLIVMSKRSRYAADSWSRRSGHGRTYEPPDEEFKCDILGCVYEEEGRPIIAYVSDGRAFEDECNSTDILVTDEPAPYGCWAPKLVVDLWDVRRNGAHAVWFEEDGLHVVTAAQVRGQRPWSKSPKPYAKKSKPKKKS